MADEGGVIVPGNDQLCRCLMIPKLQSIITHLSEIQDLIIEGGIADICDDEDQPCTPFDGGEKVPMPSEPSEKLLQPSSSSLKIIPCCCKLPSAIEEVISELKDMHSIAEQIEKLSFFTESSYDRVTAEDFDFGSTGSPYTPKPTSAEKFTDDELENAFESEEMEEVVLGSKENVFEGIQQPSISKKEIPSQQPSIKSSLREPVPSMISESMSYKTAETSLPAVSIKDEAEMSLKSSGINEGCGLVKKLLKNNTILKDNLTLMQQEATVKDQRISNLAEQVKNLKSLLTSVGESKNKSSNKVELPFPKICSKAQPCGEMKSVKTEGKSSIIKGKISFAASPAPLDKLIPKDYQSTSTISNGELEIKNISPDASIKQTDSRPVDSAFKDIDKCETIQKLAKTNEALQKKLSDLEEEVRRRIRHISELGQEVKALKLRMSNASVKTGSDDKTVWKSCEDVKQEKKKDSECKPCEEYRKQMNEKESLMKKESTLRPCKSACKLFERASKKMKEEDYQYILGWKPDESRFKKGGECDPSCEQAKKKRQFGESYSGKSCDAINRVSASPSGAQCEPTCQQMSKNKLQKREIKESFSARKIPGKSYDIMNPVYTLPSSVLQDSSSKKDFSNLSRENTCLNKKVTGLKDALKLKNMQIKMLAQEMEMLKNKSLEKGESKSKSKTCIRCEEMKPKENEPKNTSSKSPLKNANSKGKRNCPIISKSAIEITPDSSDCTINDVQKCGLFRQLIEQNKILRKTLIQMEKQMNK